MTLAANDLVVPIALTLIGVVVSFAFAIAIGGTAHTKPPPPPPPACPSRFLGDRCTCTGPHDLHTHLERFWWDTASEDPREEPAA